MEKIYKNLFFLKGHLSFKKQHLAIFASVLLFTNTVSAKDVYSEKTNESNIQLSASQQKQDVTGVVSDENGQAITGVVVSIEGTTTGDITRVNGEYSIKVATGEVLLYSFIGYKTKKIIIGTEAVLNVRLEVESLTGDEVVIIGYGGVQKAKTLTASAVNVKMSEIVGLPVTSVSDALGGRVTGVTSQSRSGAPGETTKIWIRGGDKILYVIDDVVMETDQGEIFFNRLRPDDISSMTILKDASATAIYGPRANDGVVVVQTKRGTRGSLDVVFSQKVSVLTPSYKPEVMSAWDYVNTRNDVYAASYAETPAYNDIELSKYHMGHLNQQGASRQDILNTMNATYGDLNYTMSDINDLFDPKKTQGGDIENYFQTYDPWDLFNHVQPMTQSNLSVRGGSERINYYSSLGYLDQKGISKTYGYEQYNVMLNSDALLLKDKSLKFTLNLNGILSSKDQPSAGDGVFNNAMFGHDKPTRPGSWSTGLPRSGSVNDQTTQGFNNTDDIRLQTNIGLKWSLPWVEGLSAGASLSYTTSSTDNKIFYHNSENVYGNPAATRPNDYNPDQATVEQKMSNYSLTTGIYQIDYNNSFKGKHNVSAMATYQSQVRETNFNFGKKRGYPTTFVPQVGAGAKMDGVGGGQSLWGSSSLIGRVTYDYENKYLFSYSANYNASLSYSPDKRWGLFQAVSAGWVLSEENFLKNSKAVNMLKIRASYGIVGGEIGTPFSFMNQYGQNDSNNNALSNLLLGDNMSPNSVWRESHVASDLTWSSSRQLSGGVDFELLDRRLNGSFDTYIYFNNGASMDMNSDMAYTPLLGMPNIPQVNAPFETSRKGGIEFSLNWSETIGDFRYRIGGNYSYWDQTYTRHTGESVNNYYAQTDRVGSRNMQPTYWIAYGTSGLFGSYDQMYGSHLVSGRNNSPGTFIINDVNGDGMIQNIGDYAINDRAGVTPLTLYGLTLSGGWRDFNVELFFQGATNVTGNVPSPLRSQQDYMWNYGQYGFDQSYTPGNPNVNANLPIATNANAAWGYNFMDEWVFDASYIKLKNVSINYDLKNGLLRNVSYIKGLSVSFIINNAYTWVNSDYPLEGMTDPEYIPSEGIWGGNKLGSYPTQRSYTLGISLTL